MLAEQPDKVLTHVGVVVGYKHKGSIVVLRRIAQRRQLGICNWSLVGVGKPAQNFLDKQL